MLYRLSYERIFCGKTIPPNNITTIGCKKQERHLKKRKFQFYTTKLLKKPLRPALQQLHQQAGIDADHRGRLAQLHGLALGQVGKASLVQTLQLGQLGVVVGVHQGAVLRQLHRAALFQHLADELGAEIMPAALPADMHHGGICGQRKCRNGITYRTHLAQSREFLKKLLTVPLGVGLSYQWR